MLLEQCRSICFGQKFYVFKHMRWRSIVIQMYAFTKRSVNRHALWSVQYDCWWMLSFCWSWTNFVVDCGRLVLVILPRRSLESSVLSLTCKPKQTTHSYQRRIYYEANEASVSGPRHLGTPTKILTRFRKWTFLLRKKSLKVSFL